MKRIVLTLLILAAVAGFAFACGEKEEISTPADSVAVAASFVIEEAADHTTPSINRLDMVAANTTRYNFIGILDNKKRSIA